MFDDGTPVKTADDWQKRREEILQVLARPDGPVAAADREAEDRVPGEGAARRRHAAPHQARDRTGPARSTMRTCSSPTARGRSRPCWSSSTRRRPASAWARPSCATSPIQLAKRGFVTLSLGSAAEHLLPEQGEVPAPAAVVPRLRRRQLLQRAGQPAGGRPEADRRRRPLLRRQVGDVRLVPVRQVRLRGVVRRRHRLRREARQRQLLGAVVPRLRAGRRSSASRASRTTRTRAPGRTRR